MQGITWLHLKGIGLLALLPPCPPLKSPCPALSSYSTPTPLMISSRGFLLSCSSLMLLLPVLVVLPSLHGVSPGKWPIAQKQNFFTRTPASVILCSEKMKSEIPLSHSLWLLMFRPTKKKITLKCRTLHAKGRSPEKSSCSFGLCPNYFDPPPSP